MFYLVDFFLEFLLFAWLIYCFYTCKYTCSSFACFLSKYSLASFLLGPLLSSFFSGKHSCKLLACFLPSLVACIHVLFLLAFTAVHLLANCQLHFLILASFLAQFACWFVELPSVPSAYGPDLTKQESKQANVRKARS